MNMTVGETIHYVRGLTFGLKACGVDAQGLYEVLHTDGITEGFRVEKVGVNYDARECFCPFCGKPVGTADDDDNDLVGDILMCLADPDYADEMEFAENTGLVMFCAIVHSECREPIEPNEARRTIFEAGMVNHMAEVQEMLEAAQDIANGVIAKEKEKMQS